jgi:hypothetical protein
LFATGDFDSESVHRGVRYLAATQRDGSWEDAPFTGTGFPRVFYLKYHLYSLYFPIIALGEFARHHSGKSRMPREINLASGYQGLPEWQMAPRGAGGEF